MGNDRTTGDWAEPVLDFWFGELGPAAWFHKDERVDEAIRARFAPLYRHLQSVSSAAATPPRECLAAVIALDQFPRNMFRGSPQAFATDRLALAIAERAIAAGHDRELDQSQRQFLYMPFQHSEAAHAQARSVELFAQLEDQGSLDFAQRHKQIIDRFGRFPHRNAVLGRASTAQEIEFLKTHRGF